MASGQGTGAVNGSRQFTSASIAKLRQGDPSSSSATVLIPPPRSAAATLSWRTPVCGSLSSSEPVGSRRNLGAIRSSSATSARNTASAASAPGGDVPFSALSGQYRYPERRMQPARTTRSIVPAGSGPWTIGGSEPHPVGGPPHCGQDWRTVSVPSGARATSWTPARKPSDGASGGWYTQPSASRSSVNAARAVSAGARKAHCANSPPPIPSCRPAHAPMKPPAAQSWSVPAPPMFEGWRLAVQPAAGITLPSGSRQACTV